jgi:hypothetical protein
MHPSPKLLPDDYWEKKAQQIGDAAIAIASGLSGKFSFKPFELSVSSKDMLAEYAKRLERRRNKAELVVDKYESIYFDLIGKMKQVTRPENGEHLNLIFLIDDLDRCMPDKAVQMLESIKLFLDVEGCSFVLALDEEVIDRGIEYHYQAYRESFDSNNDAIAYAINKESFAEFSKSRVTRHNAPITGAEYLEKLVQLPFHLPILRRAEVSDFSIDRFPDLFELPKKAEAAPTTMPETTLGLSLEPHERAPAWREPLLQLFLNAVPHVPRKLIRAAHLLRLARDTLHERGWRDFDMLTLARVVLLQLFAPGLYRFGRRNPAFIQKLEEWATETEWQSWVSGREGKSDWRDNDFLDAMLGHETNQVRFYRELGLRLKECIANRSGFDVRNLFQVHYRSATTLRPYLALQPEAATPQVTVVATATIPFEALGPAGPGQPVAAPDLPETGRVANLREFLGQLFSDDPIQVSNAVQQEADNILGKALDAESFSALLNEAVKHPLGIDSNWLELVSPHLSAKQFRRLLQEARLLDHLCSRLERAEA